MDAERDRHRLAEAARQLRESGVLGRADVLGRLFDFLLECSLADHAPKEAEIAQKVFGAELSPEAVEDASVRVYIHRLRRKLADHRDGADGSGARLSIPRGEYRLVLTTPAIAPAEDSGGGGDAAPLADDPPVPLNGPPRLGLRLDRRAWLGLGLLSAVNLGGWALWGRRGSADPFAAVERTGFWRPLAAGGLPLLLVAGDVFLFGEVAEAGQVRRLVREPGIDSREDLDRYLMNNPELAGRYRDVDLHDLPGATLQALQQLLPLANGAAGRAKSPLRLSLMSKLAPDQPLGSNMLYVGLLGGVGLLREALSFVSGFEMADGRDELVDLRTRVRYGIDRSGAASDRPSHRDFSYLASWAGPAGNRIMIVAGMGDAGLMQAARIAADPARLAQVSAGIGAADAFEALFEVSTLGNLDLNSKLIVARPIVDRGAAARAGSASTAPS